MEAISFKEVSRTFQVKGGVIHALQALSMEIPSGTIFGLAGINGAGKTTAIKTLLGMSRPDAGEVKVNGRHPSALKASEIGFAPEIADLPDFLTVEEVLTYSCALIEYRLDKQRLEKVLDLLELSDSRSLVVGNLSKGTRQRVSLAAAIAHDPALIVLDEPTSGLDPLGRKLVKKLLKQLKTAGKTVFFSTHILPDLQEICDVIGILHQGRLVFAGSPAEFYAEDKKCSLDERFEKMLLSASEKVEGDVQ